jgi:threonine dehydrogenase-like Zn-dependent dehydrogenase
VKPRAALVAYALGIASAYLIDRAARRVLIHREMEADRLEAEETWANQEEGESIIRERRADWSAVCLGAHPFVDQCMTECRPPRRGGAGIAHLGGAYETVPGTEDQAFMAPTAPDSPRSALFM